ncbi:MAG: hypothetical protein DMF62_11520 [Acidobacteria bacterium]|nr:MAG: hypothetical protein DMF62_11520 [Acidobacteriota bacterium]
MKRIGLFLLTLTAAALFAACGAPPANTGNTAVNTTNSNANAKPAPAAPTLATLKDLETKAFDAYKNKDGKFFEGFLDEKFVMGGTGQKMSKADVVKAISEHKCEVKSTTFSDEKMMQLGADAAAIVMKVDTDETCDGKKSPTPVISTSVYVRSGDTWKGAFHDEIPVVDPKAPPTVTKNAPATNSQPAKPAESNKMANAGSNSAYNTNSNSASNSNSMANTSSGGDTDALMALEKRGWEAWKAKDAAAFESILAKEVIFVDLFGNVAGSRADVIKMWTADNKCEIKSVAVTDGSSVSFAKDVSLLEFKGSADGTCEGMKVKPVWGYSVYVKEGDAWKGAFLVENPAS